MFKLATLAVVAALAAAPLLADTAIDPPHRPIVIYADTREVCGTGRIAEHRRDMIVRRARKLAGEYRAQGRVVRVVVVDPGVLLGAFSRNREPSDAPIILRSVC